MSTIDAAKIKKDIADLKDKKETLLFSLENDIKAIEATIDGLYDQVGRDAYAIFKDGKDSMAELGGHFANVDKCKDDQAAKRKKMDEVSERYDDEITMFEKLIPAEPEPVAPVAVPMGAVPAGAAPAGGSGFCSSCGKPSTGNDKFCMGCGTKLI